MTHRVSTAFQSDGVAISDFCCDGCDSRHVTEECTSGHELAITRAGAWLRRDAHGTHLADPTRVMFFNDGVPYDIQHPVAGGDRCLVITYAPAVLDDVANEIAIAVNPECSPFRSPACAASAELQLLSRRLDAAVKSGATRALECEELCLQILAVALRSTEVCHARARSNGSRAARHRALASDALLVLMRDYREPMRLADLAATLGCSPFHLARVFRQETGQSIHQRVLSLRLSVALERITTGTQQIGAIAHDLGFCDHAHLSAAFTRRYGISPQRVRRALPAQQE